MPTVIDHFDALTERGLRVIPLRENSKIPMCKAWNNHWDRRQARSKLEVFPDANIGLLLGEIIDVEGDSDEANHVIQELVGNYPHPSYQSVRSVHHLFATPDPTLRIFRVGEIEFRGHGHQSVLPPSSHHGFQYHWLKNFCFPPPEMPDKLLRFYQRHTQGIKDRCKPGHIRVWCDCCRESKWIHRKRFYEELAVFKLIDQKWTCHQCRNLDIRSACRMLRGNIAGHKIRINALQQF
jgi:hypothetical protein